MQRLVTHQNPEGKETPLLLLGALREIDPMVELAYAGGSRWWLGSVSDNSERRARAENMMKQITAMERQHQSARTMMLCKLNLQGFALIEAYFGNDPSGTVTVNPGPDEYMTTILDDFRWRDAEWRRDQGSAHFTQRMSETMRDAEKVEAEARGREFLANDGRDQYRRLVRGRFQFGHGGMAGGDRALIIPAR